MSAALRYQVAAPDPSAHLFRVTVTVDDPDPAGQAFRFPAWIPGSYLIRDLARHVVGVQASADGMPVGLVKTDKSTWQADPVDAPLMFTAEIFALDLSVRGAYLDTEHGFYDGACVFPSVVGRESERCLLEIEAPPIAGWRLATAMRRVDGDSYEFGTFEADDYWELIDHPAEMGNFLIGEFEVHGIPHAIAVQGHEHFDMGRICNDLQTLCECQVSFLGRPDNLDRYLFLLTVKETGYGGLEHRWSTAVMCSRKDMPRRGESKVRDDYRKFLGLMSHEYFHLWNVKRMKPERFTPYDLTTERHTGLLWVFEGITSYYDDLFVARAGLISAESYLETVAKTLTRVLRTPGRHRMDIETSSFDAWTKLYKQDANSPNAMISYYAKGSLVALALDLTIRRESGAKYSLDDVMHECWRRYGETGEGMPERGLESVARSVTGLALEDFFERYVRGTVDPPFGSLLRTVGVRLNLRPATDSNDTGGKPAPNAAKPSPWLGATLAGGESASRFSVVRSGSPAEQAGIAPGDEAIALNGLRLSAENLDRRLADHHAGDTVTLTVFREDRMLECRVILGEPPEDTCWLVIDEDADDAAVAARNDWLGPR